MTCWLVEPFLTDLDSKGIDYQSLTPKWDEPCQGNELRKVPNCRTGT